MPAFWPIADVRTERPNIALNDAMIPSYDANLGRMEFSERTASLSATATPAGISAAARGPRLILVTEFCRVARAGVRSVNGLWNLEFT
jgi:hypothetical protein